MTSVKISQLPAAGALDGGEVLPVVKNGVTVGATTSQMAAFAGTRNLSDLTDDLAAIVNLGAAAAVENVAAQAALTATPKVIDLQGYETLGDGGGGLLVHEPLSIATVNNTTVFPAITGRYTRPVDGVLHSKRHGILPGLTTGVMATRMQQFLWDLCEPGTLQYRGFLDPGTYDCGGATLYWKRNDGVAHQMAGTLEGATRRLCVIRNATLAVGSAPWYTLIASVANMRNIRVEGFLDILNCEGNSLFENCTVARPPDTTFERTGYPVDGVTPTPPFPLAFDTTGWTGWMMNTYNCNHPLFINQTIDGHVGHLDYKKGVILRSTANAKFIMGTIFGCGSPGAATEAALQFEAGGTQGCTLDRLKFEQCESVNIWDRSSGSNNINIWTRQGASHGLLGPMIRIGEQGVVTPKNTVIRGCTFLNDRATLGAAIRFDSSLGGGARDNYFSDYAIGIDPNNAANGAQELQEPTGNRFDGTVIEFNRGAATKLDRPIAIMAAPLAITDAATINIDFRNGRRRKVTVGGNRTVAAPTNYREGDDLELQLVKSNGAAAFTWNAIFEWEGGVAPALLTMTTTQHAIIRIRAVDRGAGVILAASYEIVGAVTAGAVTQGTNKTTGVTLNFKSGAITMNAAELAADTTVGFILTNSRIAVGDVLALNHVSGGTVGAYTFNAQCAAGSATINVRNITAGALSEAVVIQFIVIKAVT